ncbi:phosphoribosyltransferase family protein [Chitinophagaceae bacterium LB-8]|uniref:Phosphoribosyltransferase family protein n=1 Tax=Paraflavisolibacter caeni TaxID=2982496 RepID=A0A9X2XVD4_9BACT|nr:phosphoribosyltransferase family protein [Paraflavisolibacter caeni]MCU7549092.1 phosphoribosyltransferase family protein [Paraflavisolibacter caeni]
MFQNRTQAGRLLAEKLLKYQKANGIVLAIPRGGVPVGLEIARALNWPLELLLIKKLGHPQNKEYAIGAVGMQDRIVVPHEEVPESYIESETERARARLVEMQQKFMPNKQPEPIKDRVVIVVDDGIATGNTMLTSVKILRKQEPEAIIIAAPVASWSAVEKLSQEVDKLVLLDVPEEFIGVGRFYSDFAQLTDSDVINYIKMSNE